MSEPVTYDRLDKQIINALQGGFPIIDKPYVEVASWFDIGSVELISRLDNLLETGALKHFGPLYNSECMGGAFTLAALIVPQERYDEVTTLVNKHPQVTRNYAIEHTLNMWFVIFTEMPEKIETVIYAIEKETGLKVYNFPKQREYFIGLRLEI